MANIIEGAGVILRELTVAQVASLLDERAVAGHGAPDYPFDGTRAAAAGFQGRSPQQHRPGFGMYQIVRIADGLVGGDIGFYAPPQGGSLEVGFGLATSARRAGHGSEAQRLLVGWAVLQGDVRRVVARTLVANQPCKAMLAQVGFTEVGTVGDLIHYSWTPPTTVWAPRR